MVKHLVSSGMLSVAVGWIDLLSGKVIFYLSEELFTKGSSMSYILI
jgi:hypothetical protein